MSVFAARFGAVDRRDDSFAIRVQGRKVITRILDEILSPPQAGDKVHADRHPQQLGCPQQNIERLNVSGLRVRRYERRADNGCFHNRDG
ncbi:hypothetical protein DL765_004944 [Monosporascus sp. GIB2]|nr:hypothetical protein DL765_004944 [Monosporascus sp. GIB2]